jgi:dTDP-4-dehydrorhamnose reductase
MPTLEELDVVLIAPSGMLGRAWAALLQSCGIRHRTIGRPDFDLTDTAAIIPAVQLPATHVINCAAYANVDRAESEPGLATRINGAAPGALAEACNRVGAVLVHYSTDYVFDGTATVPYPTGARPNPVNAYGRSKLLGERLIGQAKCRHLIIRTSFLYAAWGSNFFLTIERLSRDGRRLDIVDDQVCRPTSAMYLAERSLALLLTGAEGTYHVTDGGACSRYQFSREVFRLLGRTTELRPCATVDVPRPAQRPLYTVLDLAQTDSRVGAPIDWRANLATVVNSFTASASSLSSGEVSP